MSVLPILELPDPVLRRKAKKVRNIDSSVLRLAYDMVDTMKEAGGVGLAANQVGELKRIIVIQLTDEDEARIYINPEIVQREGEREIEEGCLSIPGYRGLVTRSLWVKFRALDHTSKTVKLKAEELLSQALEHEVDHLNGILYLDHLDSHDKSKLWPVEPADEESEESQEASEEPDPADAQVNEESTDDLRVPGQDSRETPASLKVK